MCVSFAICYMTIGTKTSPLHIAQPTTPVLNSEDASKLNPKTTILSDFSSLLNGQFVGFKAIEEFLSQQDQEQILDQIDQLAAFDGQTNTTVIELLWLGELARINPLRAAAKIWDFPKTRWDSLLTMVFGEWAIVNLDDAFSAAAELNWSMRKVAVSAILTERSDLEYSEIMYRASALHLNSFIPQWLAETKSLQVSDRPQQAWESLIQDNVSDRDQIDRLVQVVQDMIQEDGHESIQKIYRTYSSNFPVLKELVSALAAQNPEFYFEHILGASMAAQDSLAAIFLQSWAAQEPEQALLAAERIRKSSVRYGSQNLILATWAAVDPFAVLDKLPSLPDAVRHGAATAAIRHLARRSPGEALKRLAHLPETLGNVSENTEIVLVEEWVKQDAVSAFEWIESTTEKGGIKRSRMMQRLLLQYSLVDPDRALQIALSELPSGFWDDLELVVIKGLVRDERLDSAITLLDKLPEKTQVRGYVDVGQALVLSNRPDAAIDLAQRLSADAEIQYFRDLTRPWMEFKPQDLVDRLATWTSNETKAAVAAEILNLYESGKAVLTQAQRDSLSKLVDN